MAHEIIQAGGIAQSPNDGDGTKMAFWVGAAPQKNYPWGISCYSPLFYSMDPVTWKFFFNGPYYNNMSPAITVNQLGKRYMNEECHIGMATSLLAKQPDMLSYTIWTESLAYAFDRWESFGRYYDAPDDLQIYTSEQVIQIWNDGLGEGAMETPLEKIKVDTLEELAARFALPIQTLKATIEDYNQKCERGFDDEFAKRAGRLIPVDMQGPFYAMKYMPVIMEVFGGPRCDVDGRVLDAEDNPIEGLYEVGSMMGDIYQSIYSFLVTGANMGFFCITYGYLTGKALAEGTI
jgi:succinate dehydrogenase/fumarate reductase flavoprotein subunit